MGYNGHDGCFTERGDGNFNSQISTALITINKNSAISLSRCGAVDFSNVENFSIPVFLFFFFSFLLQI